MYLYEFKNKLKYDMELHIIQMNRGIFKLYKNAFGYC